MRTLTDELKFEYLADSAVLIDLGGTKALIDGLPSDSSLFDKLPPETEAAVMNGEGEFAELKSLFFTHCHGDHFSGKKLASYLDLNPRSFVCVPKNARIDFEGYGRAGADFFVPEGEKGVVHRAASGTSEMDFEYMKTEHLSFDYPEHYAYNFLLGDTGVIFTGDMDLVKLKMLQGFTRREHGFLFAASFLLWHKRWCDIIDSMGFERVFICHVPSEDHDPFGYRRKALECWPANGAPRKGWEILNL